MQKNEKVVCQYSFFFNWTEQSIWNKKKNESVILGTYTLEHIIFYASLVTYIISIQNHDRANPWYAYCITTYDACNWHFQLSWKR